MISIKKVLLKIIEEFQPKPELLWTNPNITSSFSSTTINSSSSGWVGPSDLSQYSFIEVYYRSDQNETDWVSTKAKAGEKFRMVSLWNYRLCRRGEVTTSGIYFYDGYGAHYSKDLIVNNNACVPYKIYGIK